MTRSELIDALQRQNPHLTLREVTKIIDIFFGEISEALAREQRVELRGFGSFQVKRRKARKGRNPRTGESVQVAEKTIPFFRAGRSLILTMNEGKPLAAPTGTKTES